MKCLKHVIENVNSTKQKPIEMKIDNLSNGVKAHRIQAPKIILANNFSNQPTGTKINLNSLADSKSFNNWVVIYDPPSAENISTIVGNLKKAGGKFKVNVEDPLMTFKVEKKTKVCDIWKSILKKLGPSK